MCMRIDPFECDARLARTCCCTRNSRRARKAHHGASVRQVAPQLCQAEAASVRLVVLRARQC